MRPDQLSRALLSLRTAVVADLLAALPAAETDDDRARARCETDVLYHLENLASAVVLGTPSLFASYAAWARDVLAARGFGADYLPLAITAIGRALEAAPLPAPHQALALEALAQGRHAAAGPTAPPAPALPDGFAVAVQGDRNALLDLVERWRQEGGTAWALRQLARVQHEVGEAWLRNDISVAQEHRATALAQLALSMLAPHTAGAPGARPRGRAVVACAEGDWHAVGPRIAADLLELDGYEVEFLGANVPVEELVRACRERRPSLVGIGCAPLAALPAARAAAEAIRRELPEAVVLVGGRAARIAGAEPLGADHVAGADFDGRLGR